MSEIYSSIQQHISSQLKISGSRFITDAFPITDELSSKEYLNEISKKYFDATHHCFAYVIGAEGKIIRYSDDGEPSGTAGVKICNAIQSKNLSDILVVVTRYFGGTKLGVGGLSRAYYDAVEQTLQQAHIISKAQMQDVNLKFAFEFTNPVMNVLHSNKIKIVASEYGSGKPDLRIQILESKLSAVKSSLVDATNGSIKFTFGNIRTEIL